MSGMLSEPVIRIDVWLDVACLFKTRSEAQAACKAGRVTVNGQSVKPNRALRPRDEITIKRPLGRSQRLIVLTVTDAHLKKADARGLYEDLTPPPTPEEIEQRRLERIYRATMGPSHAPDKRERRAIRELKGRD